MPLPLRGLTLAEEEAAILRVAVALLRREGLTILSPEGWDLLNHGAKVGDVRLDTLEAKIDRVLASFPKES